MKMLTQTDRREWGVKKMISHVSVSSPKIIVTLDAVEMRQVIDDVHLPGRGIIVHRKVDRAFAAFHQMGDGTILVHPEMEQQIRDALSASFEEDINAMILRGYKDGS